MTLREYLTKHGLTATAFAESIGVSHATVVRLANGKRRPSWEVMARIERLTRGDVRATDFSAADTAEPAKGHAA